MTSLAPVGSKGMNTNKISLLCLAITFDRLHRSQIFFHQIKGNETKFYSRKFLKKILNRHDRPIKKFSQLQAKFPKQF